MTPHASTGVSPAELLMGRRLHSHLSMFHPCRCGGDRGSYSGTGEGESKSNSGKTEEVA